MAEAAEQHNPFQAPESKFTVSEEERLSEIRLGPDAEFGISTRFIIAREDFSLPPVCIISGSTQDLRRKSRVFRFLPQFPGRLLVAGRVLGIIVLLQLIPELAELPQFGLGQALFAVVAVAMLLSPLITRAIAEPVQVVWYVSRRVMLKTVTLYAVAGVIVAVAVNMIRFEFLELPMLGQVRPGWIFALLCIAAAVVLSFRPRRLSAQGRFRDLFVFTGFSQEFYEQVLADRRADTGQGDL